MTDIKVAIVEDNFDNYYDDLLSFCIQAENESKEDQTKKNMAATNWINNPHCLLYRIYKKKSFGNDNGMLTLTYVNKKIVSCSGVERSEFDPKNITIIMKRHYVLRDYRNIKINGYGLPFQFSWSTQRNIKVALITVNEYQTGVLEWVRKKLERGKNPIYWSMPFLDISRISIYPQKVFLYNTVQSIIVHYLDINYKLNIPKEILI